MKKLGFVLLLALFVYAAPVPPPAPVASPDPVPIPGVVFQVETTYHSGSPGVESSEMTVEKPNLKMEIQSGRGGSGGGVKDEVIFRGDRRQMVVVDHREKSYMVVDEAAARAMGGQMQQAMKELEKQLEGLDPKQREMMEKMLKGKTGPGGTPPGVQSEPREYKRTGERATKQGYPCVRYDVLRSGEKVQELWVTDWSNVEGSQDVVDVFGDMNDFYGELIDAFKEVTGAGGGFFGADRDPIETFTQIDGFPVVSRDFEGGELESETVLRSVTERDLDPDAFEPPKGYRLRSMGPQ